MAFAAPMNVFPFSDIICTGSPLLATKRLKLRRKKGVVRSVTRSRCTALTTQHVHRHIQTFLERPSCLTNNNPVKSTPVYENCTAFRTQHAGSGVGEEELYNCPSCLL